MTKYLFQASYGAEGVKGLLKDGGSKRREAVEQLAKGVGGKVDEFYFAFGESDAIVVADLPDAASAAALALAVNASGVVRVKTTVLMTVEEVDKAAKKNANYRAPGK